MNLLCCPSGTASRAIKQALNEANIAFTTEYKDSDSTIRFFTENNSFKGSNQINGYINSLKK